MIVYNMTLGLCDFVTITALQISNQIPILFQAEILQLTWAHT